MWTGKSNFNDACCARQASHMQPCPLLSACSCRTLIAKLVDAALDKHCPFRRPVMRLHDTHPCMFAASLMPTDHIQQWLLKNLVGAFRYGSGLRMTGARPVRSHSNAFLLLCSCYDP